MINTRNGYGLKDSLNCYLTIKGQKYEQWFDGDTLAEAKNKVHTSPAEFKYIIRKHKDGFYRIYYK